EALWQAQVVGVAPGHRQLLAGAGDLLQQIAPQHQVTRAGGFHTYAAGAAHGSEQHRQGSAHALQFDTGFGEIGACATGDEAMPDAADPLFDFDGKGHEQSLRSAFEKQKRPARNQPGRCTYRGRTQAAVAAAGTSAVTRTRCLKLYRWQTRPIRKNTPATRRSQKKMAGWSAVFMNDMAAASAGIRCSQT